MSFPNTTIKINNENILVRQFNSGDSVEELTRLLNISYKPLADIGLKFLASHQDSKITLERISEGICLIALLNEKIIATITYVYPKNTSGTPWYNKPNVTEFGQYAVDPKIQKIGIGTALLNMIEKYAFINGVEELACNTSEKAQHLIDFYTKRGYRFIEYVQWEVTNYRSVVLSKKLSNFYK